VTYIFRQEYFAIPSRVHAKSISATGFLFLSFLFFFFSFSFFFFLFRLPSLFFNLFSLLGKSGRKMGLGRWGGLLARSSGFSIVSIDTNEHCTPEVCAQAARTTRRVLVVYILSGCCTLFRRDRQSRIERLRGERSFTAETSRRIARSEGERRRRVRVMESYLD